MERTALQMQIDGLRDAVLALRDHLNDSLGRLEGFSALVARTAEEARDVAETLGARPSRGSLVPLGLVGFLGAALLTLWAFSPETLSRAASSLWGFLQQQTRQRRQTTSGGTTPT